MGDRDPRPSAEQQRWIEAAWTRLDPARLREIAVSLVGIPSPTGEEAALATQLAATMTSAGISAHVQPIDADQANAVGRIAGDGTGEDLLLYAPIDTLTTGTAGEDVPWVGPQLRPDMTPAARVEGDYVVGLGASNPKGHAAAIVAAAEAIAAAGIPLRGDLILGFGAGGMPTNGRVGDGRQRYNTGQGSGCSYLLEQGVWPDHAVIAKPGWSVSWEEVGLCWFEVSVGGTFTYVGSRHRMPYRNAIAAAGVVIDELERWFPEYATRHTDGLVAPQGMVAAIEGGWMRMAAVAPAVCRFMVDLRISPRTSPAQARQEFAAAIGAIAQRHPEIELSWQMTLSIPGTHTDPGEWVIRTATCAWEELAGGPHQLIVENSGATDANILRGRGIPTARIGMDRIGPGAPLPLDFASGQNVLDTREATRLARHLVHTAVNVCTRERGR